LREGSKGIAETRFFTLRPNPDEDQIDAPGIIGFSTEHLKKLFHLRGPEKGATPEQATVLYALYQEVRNNTAVYLSSLDYLLMLFPDRLNEYEKEGTQTLLKLRRNLQPILLAISLFRELDQEINILLRASYQISKRQQEEMNQNLEQVSKDVFPTRTLKMSINERFRMNARMFIHDMERLEELNFLVIQFLSILPEYKRTSELSSQQIGEIGQFKQKLILFKDKLSPRD
jgi:hypothetical protein